MALPLALTPPPRPEAPALSLVSASSATPAGRRFWRCPVRLVTDGTWTALRQSGRTVTSLIPVLALHTWPGKQGTAAGTLYTPWAALPVARIAELSGVIEKTARKDIKLLAAPGRRMLEQRQTGRGFEFRLSAYLWPGRFAGPALHEQFATIPAELVFGGTWAQLSPAARHLLIVIAASDPVYAPDRYRAGAGETEDDPVARCRARAPLSIADLKAQSGLTRTAVKDALAELTTAGLIVSGPTGHGRARWIAPNWSTRHP